MTQTLRLEKTASTQDIAKRLAASGAPDGTLVRADRQTAGRGRLDRAWASAPGGLYVSLVKRPKCAPQRLAEVSLLCGQAVARALHELTGVVTAVKPPNDVLAGDGGALRKVCGILIEASGGERSLDWLVIGIGVNVNNAPALKTATSLKRLTGRRWDVDAVLESILSRLPNPL